jgi:hypothetical protein
MLTSNSSVVFVAFAFPASKPRPACRHAPPARPVRSHLTLASKCASSASPVRSRTRLARLRALSARPAPFPPPARVCAARAASGSSATRRALWSARLAQLVALATRRAPRHASPAPPGNSKLTAGRHVALNSILLGALFMVDSPQPGKSYFSLALSLSMRMRVYLQSACTNCSAGFAQPSLGQVFCLQCLSGTFNAQSGVTACAACAPGFVSQNVGSGPQACTACPVGKYSFAGGLAACLDVPAGTFGNAVGSQTAQQCPAGTFASIAGLTVCAQCAVGSYASEQGSLGCLDCPAGSFSSSTGAQSCRPCPAGTFQSATRQSSCLSCGTGQVPSLSSFSSQIYRCFALCCQLVLYEYPTYLSMAVAAFLPVLIIDLSLLRSRAPPARRSARRAPSGRFRPLPMARRAFPARRAPSSRLAGAFFAYLSSTINE